MKKTCFRPYQGITYGFDRYLGVTIIKRITLLTASQFCYRDRDHYRLFALLSVASIKGVASLSIYSPQEMAR